MDILKNITSVLKAAGSSVQGAMGVVTEKNHKAALGNRLRNVIRCEEKAAERAYIALGRYYYNELRHTGDAAAEAYCAAIDMAEERITVAVEKLEALHREEHKDEVEEVTLEDVMEVEPAAEAAEAEAEEAPVAQTPEVQETPAAQVPVDESENLPFEG